MTWFGSTQPLEFKVSGFIFLRLTTKSPILWGNTMDSTIFFRTQALMTSMVRATLIFAVSWTSVGEVRGQMFIDGDPVGTLYTEHVGGYLGQGVSFADFNGDGNDDLTFTQWTGEILTFAGDGQGGFLPVDEGIGNTEGEPKCALWIDLDNDGDQDLFVTQRLATNKLYARMPDGSLQAVPNAGGLAGSETERSYGASVADYDKDGRLDVYICHYHTPQSDSETNRLLRSIGGTDLSMTFEDVTSDAGVGNEVRQSFQATWVDVDRDGWLDLHVINDRTFWADAMYRNQGDGTFVDMAVEWGLDVQGYSMSSTVCDFDRDGDWDFVVTDGASDGNSFMQCVGGPFAEEITDSISLTYHDVAAEAGVLLEELAWGALWLDANNDGWQDLFIGTGTSLYTDYPNVLGLVGESPNGFWLNNQGQLPFQNAMENVFTDNEVTFSTAWADHNKDGAMDFVSHRIGPRARLLNGVPNANHWVQLNLVPNEGNADAIGAVASVWKNGTPDMRVMTCGSEYLNQNSKRMHFGLGDTPSIDSVVVHWPSGEKVTYLNVEPDAINTIYQDASGFSNSVLGCTYAVACNFDENATSDDGSCDWSCVCGEGTIWDETAGGCVAQCSSDQNGDGVVGAADLLMFLAAFGATCL